MPEESADDDRRLRHHHWAHEDPMRFGAHLLQLIGAIAVIWVVLHFIIKYW
jgi:hypothetical protein